MYLAARVRGDAKTLASFSGRPTERLSMRWETPSPRREMLAEGFAPHGRSAAAAREADRQQVAPSEPATWLLKTANRKSAWLILPARCVGGCSADLGSSAMATGGWRACARRTASPPAQLGDLDWLIGKWSAATADTRLTVNGRWNSTKTFLLRDLEVERDGKVVFRGSQRIGWDPVARTLRSWTFDSDGGYGGGTWTRGGGRVGRVNRQRLARRPADDGAPHHDAARGRPIHLDIRGRPNRWHARGRCRRWSSRVKPGRNRTGIEMSKLRSCFKTDFRCHCLLVKQCDASKSTARRLAVGTLRIHQSGFETASKHVIALAVWGLSACGGACFAQPAAPKAAQSGGSAASAADAIARQNAISGQFAVAAGDVRDERVVRRAKDLHARAGRQDESQLSPPRCSAERAICS